MRRRQLNFSSSGVSQLFFECSHTASFVLSQAQITRNDSTKSTAIHAIHIWGFLGIRATDIVCFENCNPAYSFVSPTNATNSHPTASYSYDISQSTHAFISYTTYMISIFFDFLVCIDDVIPFYRINFPCCSFRT